MQTAKELLVELWFLGLSQDRLEQWIGQYVEETELIIDEEYFELPDCTVDESEVLLLSIVRKSISNFSETSEDAEYLAAQLLLKKLKEYLNHQIKPVFLCQMIVEMESTFLGASRNMPKGIAYYPEWLGQLWNACDWYDENWTFENSPHLKNEIQNQILKIEEWLLNSKL